MRCKNVSPADYTVVTARPSPPTVAPPKPPLEKYSFSRLDSRGRGNPGVEFWKTVSNKDKQRYILDLARNHGFTGFTEARFFVPSPLHSLAVKEGPISEELKEIFAGNEKKRAGLLECAFRKRGGKKRRQMHEAGKGSGAGDFWRGKIRDSWPEVVDHCKWVAKVLGAKGLPHLREIMGTVFSTALARAGPEKRDELTRVLGRGRMEGKKAPSKMSFRELDKQRGLRCTFFWNKLHEESPGRVLEYIKWKVAQLDTSKGPPTATAASEALPLPAVRIFLDKHKWHEIGVEAKSSHGSGRVSRYLQDGPPAISSNANGPAKSFSESSRAEQEKGVNAMLSAASRGNADTLFTYLDAGFPLSSASGDGEAVLHRLAEEGHAPCIGEVLSHGCFSGASPAIKEQILEARDGGGMTPLILAALMADEPSPVVWALLKAGADPTAKSGGEGKKTAREYLLARAKLSREEGETEEARGLESLSRELLAAENAWRGSHRE